jgi:serine protease
VDCALGNSVCANAAGKVCLMQRGGNYFCQKVLNCMAGGGVAALIYARDDQPACEQVAGVTLLGACGSTPSGG